MAHHHGGKRALPLGWWRTRPEMSNPDGVGMRTVLRLTALIDLLTFLGVWITAVHVAELGMSSSRSPMRCSGRDHAASVVSSQSNITWWARARAPA